MHLLQPIVRAWGRLRHRSIARVDLPLAATLPAQVSRARGGVLVLAEDRPRATLAADLVTDLRRAGVRVVPATGWEAHDARLIGSAVMTGDLVTSSHPIGYTQLRVRRRLRLLPLAFLVALAGALAQVSAVPAQAVAAVTLLSAAWGWWRTGPFVRRIVERQAAATPSAA
jgi:hypothetical protein